MPIKANVRSTVDFHIGEIAPDDTIYAGVCEATRKRIFVVPDVFTMLWRSAAAKPNKVKILDLPLGTFRLPSTPELETVTKNWNMISNYVHCHVKMTDNAWTSNVDGKSGAACVIPLRHNFNSSRPIWQGNKTQALALFIRTEPI